MGRAALAAVFFPVLICAAPANRITRPVDGRHVRALSGGVHRLSQAAFDRGAVAPTLRLDHVVAMIRMSAGQEAGLEQLLADQQNPASPRYHQWLTPEEYGERFGLSASDHAKIVAWLTAEGFQVKESARSRNWVAFSGSASQVEQSLRTPIHRFEVNGEMHRANTANPSVPEALADVIEGFLGLDDFVLRPQGKAVTPNFTSGRWHYLTPQDLATIYNLTPLYRRGLDGAGQSIAVVGQSAVLMSDIRAFRTRFGLAANDPKMAPYGATEPAEPGDEDEGNLDLEWAGAIAPKATIYYVYGRSAVNAYLYAVTQNIAPILSISYGGCEIDYEASYFRAIGQQANAQGITVLASSGDSGATCDRQGSYPVATLGRLALFPTEMPEVTSVGGTEFVEGSDAYWATSNSAGWGSALSYIPEAVWNETSVANGLAAGGGGTSLYYTRPAWQRGPGIAEGGMRQYPDVSLTAAAHDGYLIISDGSLWVIGGTSASTPAMAGIVALLNQDQVAKGAQSQPGLGNINPQLYRLAQIAPAAFHDTTMGDNMVPCAQGSPDCENGTIGDRAKPGYDLATGLGSIDGEELFKSWNAATQAVQVILLVRNTRVTVNDVIYATALVGPAGTAGTVPTGQVDFSLGGVPLGSAVLQSRAGQGQVADMEFPAYQLGGTGTAMLTAQYAGDAMYSGGGAMTEVTISAGTGAAAIVVSAPDTVWPSSPDPAGPIWQTMLTLRDVGGVPSILEDFRIDGEPQPLATYFQSTALPAGGKVTVNLVFHELATPVLRKFEFTGVDVNGQTWSRTVMVNYVGNPSAMGFYLRAAPLTVTRTADRSCTWPVQLTVDKMDGQGSTLTDLYVGAFHRSDLSAVFGTDRLAPWGSLQGTVCFNDIAPPATAYIQVNDAYGFMQDVLVSLVEAPVAPSQLAVSPASVTLQSPGTSQATVAVTTNDPSQPWTVTVSPANRMASWLTVSPALGTGPGQITLSAQGAGYTPGAYPATLVIESPAASPQTVTVPLMFVLGASGPEMTIRAVGNAASGGGRGAPGGLLSIYGNGLAKTTAQAAVGSAIPSTLAGVSAAVNGVAAPVLYVSPTQVNIQVPFEAGAGPAVVGLTNEGRVAGAQFEMAPAAPGIFTDADGMISQKEQAAGAEVSVLLTGAGEVGSGMPTAFAPSPSSPLASAPKPLLAISITVGGKQAFIQTVGAAPGQVGVVQVNFLVPAGLEGKQPVVVTVGDAPSIPAYIDVEK